MKKYSSGSFIDAAVRVYGSEADTISSFPATVYADGESASAVVSGNMQQTGTPTPSSPIYPTECGELVSNNYTIPIISGGVTTNINLAEVQTTRKIKKLVLTGEENWGSTSGGYYLADLSDNYLRGQNINYALCSHNPTYPQVETIAGIPEGYVSFSFATLPRLYFKTSDIASLSDFKTYLSQQYANNIPVTVWYVLATETTTTLNEPLRKIGDNVDSVSATVPTLATAESITVDTTLKPSAVQLTYTGWHTHSDKKRSGGAWT